MRWARIPQASAAAGLIAWAALRASTWAALESLLLFAALVLAPLALTQLVAEDRRGRVPITIRAALVAQPPAALLLALSLARPAGAGAAVLAAPWLAFTLLLALVALLRFVPRGARLTEEVAIDAGLAYSAIGGAWLLASRAGIAPLGFREPLVLLTAIHFHVAAFAAPVLAGLVGRAILPASPGVTRAYRAIVGALLAGPILLALGITFSRALEVLAAIVLAAGLVGLSLAILFGRPRVPIASRSLLALAALAPLVSMAYALAYATARAVDIATMARVHGALNAYVLSFLGLAAFTLAEVPSRAPRPGMPVSALASRKTTGPDLFERERLVDPDRPAPRGLVDDLDALGVTGVAPAIRAFYEDTAGHDLIVTPHWTPGFRGLGRVYRCYAERAGQMRFPLELTPEGERIDSRIIAVRDAADGRTNVRAWVRTYAEDGGPVYVAAYSTHRERRRTFMNIAFPFPGWNLTSVLRVDPLAPDGVSLTTLGRDDPGGDQGVYFVSRGHRMRAPIDETIDVWVDAAGVVRARHEMWFLGIRFLALDYAIARSLVASGASLAP